MAADVDLLPVALALPENVTGADIGAVTSTAYGAALERKLAELKMRAEAAIRTTAQCIPSIEEDFQPDDWAIRSYINQLPDKELDVEVTQQDLVAAASNCRPSVVDLAYYEGLGDLYDDTQGKV